MRRSLIAVSSATSASDLARSASIPAAIASRWYAASRSAWIAASARSVSDVDARANPTGESPPGESPVASFFSSFLSSSSSSAEPSQTHSAVTCLTASSGDPAAASTSALRAWSIARVASSATRAAETTSPRRSRTRHRRSETVTRSAPSSNPTSSKPAWHPARISAAKTSSESFAVVSRLESLNVSLTPFHRSSAASVTTSAHDVAAARGRLRRVMASFTLGSFRAFSSSVSSSSAVSRGSPSEVSGSGSGSGSGNSSPPSRTRTAFSTAAACASASASASYDPSFSSPSPPPLEAPISTSLNVAKSCSALNVSHDS